MKNKKKIVVIISSILVVLLTSILTFRFLENNNLNNSVLYSESDVQNNENNNQDTINDTSTINDGTNKEEQEEKNEENSTSTNLNENTNITSDNNQNKPSTNDSEEESNNNTESGNVTSNQETQIKEPILIPSPTPIPTPNQDPVPVEKTLKEKNQDLINEIKSKYGYDISYGEEEFWYGGQPCTKLTDEELANDTLTLIAEASSELPSGFFKTFQGYNGYRVILFSHIEGAAGVTSYEFGDDNLIALDASTGTLKRVFFHETFHVIDQYIRYKSYGSTFPFDNWNSFNPSDFNYGDSGTKYTGYDLNSYYSYDDPSSIAFVSEYAKSSDREDRAELFADLMFRPIKKSYMNSGFAINEKAKNIATVLRNYFPNTKGARWEKYITW